MKWDSRLTWGRLALTLLAAGLVTWLSAAVGSRQIITLSDGHQYRFAGASWGTNHIPPGVLPHLYNRLPNSWRNYLQAKLGPRRWFTTPLYTQQALVIWLEPTGPSANVPFVAGTSLGAGTLGIQGALVDGKGRAVSTSSFGDFFGAGGESVFNNLPGPPGYVFLWFPVVPRRSRILECRLDETAGNTYTVVRPDMGRVKFRNPMFGHFPQWQPEALPSVKSAGADLSVRLNSFGKAPADPNSDKSAGPDLSVHLNRFGKAPADPDSPNYPFSVTFESSRGTNEKWTVTHMEVTDATGNRLAEDVGYPTGHDTYGIYGGLFPDEAAVKLKLTLKRISGFAANELMTFTNLPTLSLRPTYAPPNGTSLTNSVDGIPIVVRNFMTDPWHRMHAPRGDYGVQLEMPTNPSGVVADIVAVSSDTGKVLTAPDSVGPFAQTEVHYDQGFPTDAKFLNVTVAVQKTRTVEFLVKPQ